MKLLRSLDANSSGSLSLEELRTVWDTSEDFRGIMINLEIGRDKLVSVFEILDPDGGGEVYVHAIVDQIYATLSTRSTPKLA
eukprot:4926290-Heterocapsa_arctica.AAC.1